LNKVITLKLSHFVKACLSYMYTILTFLVEERKDSNECHETEKTKSDRRLLWFTIHIDTWQQTIKEEAAGETEYMNQFFP
jgi:hypothetical protein